MGEAGNTWADAGWSRRRALQGGGAALVAAVGIGEDRRSALTQDQEATPAATPAVPPDFKVVLHAAEEQNWIYVLSNLKNLTQEWPEARLRVVVDGTAVLTLQGDNTLTKELAEVATAGVQVQACPNALREHQIDPGSIPGYIDVGLGGVVALVRAQHEGYAYIKP